MRKPRSTWLTIIAAWTGAALVATGCGAEVETGDDVALSSAQVDIPAPTTLSPSQVAVEQGGEINFVNYDNGSHELEVPGTDVATKLLLSGDSLPTEDTVTVDLSPGEYELTCKIWDDMRGTLTVE
jgi:plastocyanin